MSVTLSQYLARVVSNCLVPMYFQEKLYVEYIDIHYNEPHSLIYN